MNSDKNRILISNEKRILDLINQGYSYRRIAKLFNVSTKSIRKFCKNRGVESVFKKKTKGKFSELKLNLSKKLKNIFKISQQKKDDIHFFFSAFLLLTYFAFIIISVFSFTVAFHNIDLSVNMLAILGFDIWRVSEDIYAVSTVNGEYVYHSAPYAYIYVYSWNKIILAFFIGLASCLGFGLCLGHIIECWREMKRYKYMVEKCD